MNVEAFMQPFIYGLQMGVTYVIIALGLTLIFSIMNILNLAHGEFYMLGAYSILYLTGLFKINYSVGLILTIIIVGLIGLFFERLFFRWTRSEMIPTIIIAVALIWILQTGAQILFGRQPRGMAQVFGGSTSILGVPISNGRLMAGFISLILVLILCVFVYKTRIGIAMQAVAQDREAAALQGIDIDRLGTLGFCLGCALAGAAGGIMAPLFLVDATMGSQALTTSLAIIVLGGVGSIPGAVLGGLILGIVQSYGQTFVGYAATLFPFAMIIFILIIKPSGLMGRAV